jgi:hypothetical protein
MQKCFGMKKISREPRNQRQGPHTVNDKDSAIFISQRKQIKIKRKLTDFLCSAKNSYKVRVPLSLQILPVRSSSTHMAMQQGTRFVWGNEERKLAFREER